MFPNPNLFTESQRLAYQDQLERVKISPRSISRVPAEYRTKELILEVVRRDGLLLAELAYLTPVDREIALAAVGNNGFALTYLPLRLRTHDVCRAAVEGAQGSPVTLATCTSAIPKQVFTKELCELIVRRWPDDLYRIPGQFQTPEMWAIAHPTPRPRLAERERA